MKAHVQEDWTGSRLTYVEREGVKRSKKRRNGGRVIRERDNGEKLGGRER